MVGAFFSALGLFSMARLGGIPVPSTRIHKVLWFVVFMVQVVEYILVFLSAIMLILAYFHVRYFHRSCMYEASEWLLVADLTFFATMFALPVINQALLILFIYAYVISTCLKVWRATPSRTVESSKRTKDNEYMRLPEEPSPRGSTEETFKRDLVRTDQPWPIALWHVRIAFLGLALSSLISVPFGGLLFSFCFYPDAVAMVIIIKLTFAFVRWVEDDLFKGKEKQKVDDDRSQTKEPSIRKFTGWFRDIGVYLSEISGGDTYLHGFQVRRFFEFARIQLDGAYREKIVGDWDSMGGGDAGFFNMAYGFTIFFTCIALAPATCYAVWTILPVIMGSLPFSEAIVLVQLYYEQIGGTYATVINELINFEFKWDWPEWFNWAAVCDFLEDPYRKLYEAMYFVINAIAFLNFDLDNLIEGSRALLRLNSVFALVKPGATLILQCWILLEKGYGTLLKYDPELKDDFPSLVTFGDCLPGKAHMERAARVRRLKTRDLSVNALKGKGYIAAEFKEAAYEARDLLSNGFGLKELLDAPYSLKDLREAGVTANELKSQGVRALQMYNAGYTYKELTGAFEFEVLRRLFSPSDMKNEGYHKARDLKRMGYRAEECKGVFGAREIIEAYGDQVLKGDLFDLNELHSEGVLVDTLLGIKVLKFFGPIQLGYKPKWSKEDLQKAGYVVVDGTKGQHDVGNSGVLL